MRGPIELENRAGGVIRIDSSLTHEHRQYLLQRGVPPDWALDAGYRSVNRWEAKRLLNRSRNKPIDGLAIPYGDGRWTVRLDQPFDRRKFMFETNTPTRAYLPPLSSPLVWSDTAVPIVFCEGPVKAASIVCAGIPAAIGLAGACGGGHNKALRDTERIVQLHPVLLASVVWPGRRVIIMMDSDAATNKTVQAGERLLGEALASAGAQPHIARVPQVPGHDKLGPDDFLVLFGPERLRSVLGSATPWVRPHKAPTYPLWTVSRRTDAAAFVNGILPVGIRLQARQVFSLVFDLVP